MKLLDLCLAPPAQDKETLKYVVWIQGLLEDGRSINLPVWFDLSINPRLLATMFSEAVDKLKLGATEATLDTPTING